MDLIKAGIDKRVATALKKKHIVTVNDIVRYTPSKYHDYKTIKNIKDAVDGPYSAFCGKLISLDKRFSRKFYITMKFLQNDGTVFRAVLFSDTQKYPEYLKLREQEVVICGQAEYSDQYGYSVKNGYNIKLASDFTPGIEAGYSKIKGVTEEKFQKMLSDAMESIEEPFEDAVLSKYRLPGYKECLHGLHTPQEAKDVSVGKYRMLFDDLFYFASVLNIGEENNKETSDIVFSKFEKTVSFMKDLPYDLTKDQKNVLNVFASNAKNGKRNKLLVQGDVGCGKTIVAITMMMLAWENGYQAVLMAPREVLARQHYEEVKSFADKYGIEVRFLASGIPAAEKKKLKEELSSGKVTFAVGTHSVFAETYEYKNLGLVITDEEHLFGVEQKRALEKKAQDGVHSVAMSATPIPKTLASVMYGNAKEILVIHSMPKGRKPIQTATQVGHKNVYGFLQKEIQNGHQAYVVCPAIENNPDAGLVSIESVEKAYRQVFDPLGIKIGVVNGQVSEDEVKATIDSFSKNELQILISTTVIEVGVNVPNATVMVIEQADRFGLATLHQLRGRVGRGQDQSYCILISSDRNNARLNTMVATTDGFEIAEADMMERGSGDLVGVRQAGGNKYVKQMLMYPETFRLAVDVAKFCRQHGYGKKVMELYMEHELLDAKVS